LTESEEARAQRRIARIRLEMELPDFQNIKLEFLDDLAEVIGIAPGDIWITSIRLGCVILRLSLSESAEHSLETKWEDREKEPLVELFKKRYKVAWVRFYDVPETRISVIVNVKDSGHTLTWLHLSDAHFRSEEGGKKFSQDKVTGKFLEALPKLLGEWKLEPDLVFFTGDLSFSGKREEFGVVGDFLKKLQASLPRQARFLCVPGNHDVTWNNIDPEEEERLRGSLGNEDQVNSLLLDASQKGRLTECLRRLSNFSEFVKSDPLMAGHPAIGDLLYYSEVIDHQGFKIGVAGLNSVWCSTRKDLAKTEVTQSLDLGHLVMGEPQIKTALDRLREAHIKVALVHHPPISEWFRHFELPIHINSFSEFDFILRGHQHVQNFIGLDPNLDEKNKFFPLAAGALYSHPGHPNGVNAVKVDLATGIVEAFSWVYLNSHSVWRKNLGPRETGFIEFSLSMRVRERLSIPARHVA